MLEFAGRFSKPELLIKQGKFWSVVFRESNTTLGNVVFVLNRECAQMGNVTTDEMAEFADLCNWYETKIKKLYGAAKFNYAANMMKENFVHFHVLPRYDKPVEKYGLVWEDTDWPKRSSFGKLEISDEINKQIINDLKD